MGNQLAASGAAATINLSDVSTTLRMAAPLGGRRRGRLFTSMHCVRTSDSSKSSSGAAAAGSSIAPGSDVVVKVFVRQQDDRVQAQVINKHAEALQQLERTFTALLPLQQDIPCNILFYTDIVRNDRFCKLQRPFIQYSLAERLLMRPFLLPEHRLFAAYQLLQGLGQLHEDLKSVHGDLKSENVLIASSGWMYMTDFAPFKPAVIPSYNPADFEFYFDNSETRICCLAPEKFHDQSATREEIEGARHTAAMDVFSAGCVIFHLLTDEPLFKLPNVLELRSVPEIDRMAFVRDMLLRRNVTQENLVSLLTAMLGTSAEMRPSARKLVEDFTPSVFPPFFGFLYFNVLPVVLRLPPDAQIAYLWSRWDDMLKAVDRCAIDNEYRIRMQAAKHRRNRAAPPVAASRSEERDSGGAQAKEPSLPQTQQQHGEGDLPARDDIEPNFSQRQLLVSLLFPVIQAVLRHVKIFDSQAKGLMMLSKGSAYATDATRLDVLLPFLLHFLHNRSPVIRVRVIRTLEAMCSSITSLPLSDMMLYDDLVLPALYERVRDPSLAVQTELARTLPIFLQLALRTLQQRQVFATGHSWKGFDFQLHCVVQNGWEAIRTLYYGNNNSSVRVATLRAASTLVKVLGEECAQCDLIPLLTTSFDQTNIDVKRELYANAVQAQILLDGPKFETVRCFVEQGLHQSDVMCLVNTINAVADIVRKQCFAVTDTMQLVHACVPHIMNSNEWVCSSAKRLVEVAATVSRPCDVLVYLHGAIRPLLTHSVPLQLLSQFPHVIRSEAVCFADDDASSFHANNGLGAGTRMESDLLQRVANVNVISVLNVTTRTVADIIDDTSHVDVGNPTQSSNTTTTTTSSGAAGATSSGNTTAEGVPATPRLTEEPTQASAAVATTTTTTTSLVVWPMSFKATDRQRKRISRRIIFHQQRVDQTKRQRQYIQQLAAQVAMKREVSISNYSMVAAGGGTAAIAASTRRSNFNYVDSVQSPLSATEAVINASRSPMMASSSALGNVSMASNASSNAQPLNPIATPIATSKDGGGGAIYDVSFAGNLLVSCGTKGTLRLWELSPDGYHPCNRLVPVVLKDTVPETATAHFAQFTSCDNPASPIAVGTSEGVLCLVDPDSGKMLHRMELAASSTLLTTATTATTTSVDTTYGEALTACRSLDRTMLVGSSRGSIYAVDFRSQKVAWSTRLAPQDGPVSKICSLSLRDSDAGNPYAFVCGTLRGTLALFDLRFSVQVRAFKVAPTLSAAAQHDALALPSNAILSMCCDPNFGPRANRQPSVFVGTHDGYIRRYDLSTASQSLSIELRSPSQTRALFAVPRTNFVASAGADRLVRVWDLQAVSKSFVMCCPPYKSPAYRLIEKVSPTVVEGDAPNNSNAAAIPAHHDDCITAIAAATVQNAQFLVTGARDGSLTMWHNLTPVIPVNSPSRRDLLTF